MLNALTVMPGTSVAELTQEELDLVGGGATLEVVMKCEIDDSGNGTCTTTYKED